MSAPSPLDADVLAPPDDATVNAAIEEYARAIRSTYGSRVKGIYLFGSRARGDHTSESDADIAVILEDRDWDFWTEKIRLVDLAYPLLLATGAHLQGWPVPQNDWRTPQPSENAALVAAMRRDARPIGANK